MRRVLPQTGTEFLQLQLFAAGLAPHRVVVITCLFANEKDSFGLFLAFAGHAAGSFDVGKNKTAILIESAAGGKPEVAKEIQVNAQVEGGTTFVLAFVGKISRLRTWSGSGSTNRNPE